MYKLVVGISILVSFFAQASEYHYKNILIGERAAAMGEAFVAISDDPSGIYHNPAGIAFGLEDYLSLTANAYVTTQLKFKDLYPGQDYTYRFRGLVPAFFGFTQSWGRKKFGFAVVVPNSDLVDQKDSVTRSNDGTVSEINFRRKFSRQDTTYLIGPALALELFKNFSIGVSVFGLWRNVKLIDNTTIQFEPVGTGDYALHIVNSTVNSFGVLPKVGIQWMPAPKLSVGLVASRTINVTGSGEAQLIKTKLNDDNTPVTQTGTFDADMDLIEVANLFSKVPSNATVSLGVAWFSTKSFLLSGQLDYHISQTNFALFPIRDVLNWSVGAEWYLSQEFALRGAVFSNNSKTKTIASDRANQPPFVNLLATSLGISYFRSGTSLSLGTSYAWGVGQGQAFADSTLIQEVQQQELAIYISGSYQL